MPSYDYRCRECDGVFEVRRSISDTSPVRCPDGHPDVSRVFTPVAVGGPTAAPRQAAGGCCGGGCCG